MVRPSSVRLSPAVPAGRQAVGSLLVPLCPALGGAPWGMEKTGRRAARAGRPGPGKEHGSQVGCGLLATAGLGKQMDPEHSWPRGLLEWGQDQLNWAAIEQAPGLREDQQALPPHQRGALCQDPLNCSTAPPTHQCAPSQPPVHHQTQAALAGWWSMAEEARGAAHAEDPTKCGFNKTDVRFSPRGTDNPVCSLGESRLLLDCCAPLLPALGAAPVGGSARPPPCPPQPAAHPTLGGHNPQGLHSLLLQPMGQVVAPRGDSISWAPARPPQQESP